MLTGKATLSVAINAINDGAVSRFFTKPCNPKDLAVTIRQGLRHRDLMNEAKRLLKEVKRKEAILYHLELESPGITQVKRDNLGAVILDQDDPEDFDALIEELRERLG